MLDPKGVSAKNPHGSAVQTLGTLIKVVIAAILVSLTLTVLMILHVGRIQDETAAEASLRQFDGLLLMTSRHLANHVRDYAYWDEAIERVLVARDTEWWDDNPGQYALSTFDLSLTLAVDGSDRIYFISTPDGTRSAPSDLTFGPSAKALLNTERRTPAFLPLQSATTGLIELNGTLYLAAASRFLHEEDLVSPAEAPGAVMLFALAFDDTVLPELGDIMGVVGLVRDATPESGKVRMPLSLMDGTPAGILTWTPSAPGGSMIASVLPIALLAFSSVAGLTLLFAFRARSLARRLSADENERRELAQRYESILETAGDGIFGIDRDGRILFVNAAAATMLGLPRTEIQGQDANRLLLCRPAAGPVDQADEAPLLRALRSGRAEVSDTDCFRRADASRFPVEYAVTPMLLGETPTGAVVVFRDITKRRQTEEEILYRANFDSVTGLPNRNLLFERLNQELKRARREATRIGILFIDLDDFKQVNDSLGHDAGDLLLRQVAERLQRSVRETDTVARFAGDELVVVIAQIVDRAFLETISEKLLQVLREPFSIGDENVRIGGSIGIAIFPDHGDDAQALLNRADLAMYQAKAAGRGTYRFAVVA
ncbi:sensor domain-containing diguanylate cyclase [Thiocapsa rosea]|uniref:sensor domain-containing diguanylate cyclase n=1 Tax=Thiocapsa rosea TaxID=69360 RepID=UPI001474207C|nr:diguanylate cyclase [Thiocapsa rosea]